MTCVFYVFQEHLVPTERVYTARESPNKASVTPLYSVVDKSRVRPSSSNPGTAGPLNGMAQAGDPHHRDMQVGLDYLAYPYGTRVQVGSYRVVQGSGDW